MIRAFLGVVVLLIVANTFTVVPIAGDETNISDGTSSFIWDPNGGGVVLGSSTGFDDDYAAGESVYLRYRQPGGLGGGNMVTLSTTESDDGVNSVTNSATSSGAIGTQQAIFSFFDGFATEDLLQLDISYSISTLVDNPFMDQSMTVTNISSNAITDIELFNYWDWDLSIPGGTFNNQNVGIDYAIDEFTGFLQSNPEFGPPPPNSNAFRGTDTFDQWQVATFGTLEPLISGGGNLTNSGTPFGFDNNDGGLAGEDMEAALGWQIGSLDPGASFTVNLRVQTIPEPGCFGALAILGIAGGLGIRRRTSAA